MAVPVSVESKLPALWKAREEGLKSVYKPWFPKLDQAYIDSFKSTWQKHCVQAYANVYDACDFISQTITKTTTIFFQIVYQSLGYIPGFGSLERKAFQIYDYLMPINPVNGQRGLNFFPRVVEKFLGDWFFSPWVLRGKPITNREITGRWIGDINNDVLSRLQEPSANQELLNPKGSHKFDYRILSSEENVLNAFAIMGGSMLVTSHIVETIHRLIKQTQEKTRGAITHSEITMKDGSKAIVDLTDVTFEDVLAALIGHEMTHIASRHSTLSMTAGLVTFVVISILIVCVSSYFQNKHETKKDQPTMQVEFSLPGLRGNGATGFGETSWLSSIRKWVLKLVAAYRSRQDEHEADITGAYFAKNAGYNPKGALYLQECLAKSKGFGGIFDYLDFMSTHPSTEKRKTAIYTALQVLNKV